MTYQFATSDLESVLASIRSYAFDQGLSPRQVANHFDAAIFAAAALKNQAPLNNVMADPLPYQPAPAAVSLLRTVTPRFQRLDATGQITQADNYVAVLETRFNPFTGEPVRLMWAHGLIKVDDWNAGQQACAALTLCGFNDWRMPTVQERELLTDKTRHSPALDPIFNSPESGWEWTATPAAFSPADCAWGVNFDFGDCSWGSRSYGGFVRAVRVSQ